MVSACDPNVRLWINAKTLKNEQLWAAGWQTLSEIHSEIHSELHSEIHSGIQNSIQNGIQNETQP